MGLYFDECVQSQQHAAETCQSEREEVTPSLQSQPRIEVLKITPLQFL